MDIQLKKKPWYIRFRYYLLAAVLFVALVIYAVIQASGPRRYRVNLETIQTAEAVQGDFLEYVDVEGIVQPILTLRVNATEGGTVARIVAGEGEQLEKGDTILVLENPAVTRSISDQQDEYARQLTTFREKDIEMEQQRLTLRRQALQTRYELERLEKSFRLEEEEYRMGIKSKAQLELARDEYHYKSATAELEMEGLKHDSAVAVIRRQLLHDELRRAREKYERERERLADLVVRAPISGQLSMVSAVPGQSVPSGSQIAEIKVTDRFKIHASLNEYYVDRVTTGLPAVIRQQQQSYPLRVSKVVPEVKERTFDVDLLFTDSLPDNLRPGKSFRVQIELEQPEKALLIPRGNFYQQTGGRWIYKLNADRTRAVKVPITIGRQNPLQYEVTDGLQPGDWVITTGYENFGDAEELVL